MNEIIEKIDTLMTSISNDANRSQLVELSTLIVALSKLYGQAKSDYTRLKNKYENDVVMETESFNGYLNQVEDKRWKEALKTDKRAKRERITDTECKRQAELKLIKDKNEMTEQQVIVVFLEPLLRSYESWINSIKFVDKSTIQVEKMYNDKPSF